VDDINTIASECNVTVLVTHSYRKANFGLNGQLRPPGRDERTPHLIGHAIDMVLDTPSGICDSQCTNPEKSCFFEGIQNITGLEYGNGVFNDGPIHIANNLWENGSTQKWDDLYEKNQYNCIIP